MTKRLKNWAVKLRKITSNKDFVRNTGKVLVVAAYVMFVVALASEMGFADKATGEDADNFLDGITTLLTSVQGAILKWSAIAVVIGVGAGALMKKFSMGKQDKIELGNKLMKDSIIAFVILNATPRIVNMITTKLGSSGQIDVISATVSIKP